MYGIGREKGVATTERIVLKYPTYLSFSCFIVTVKQEDAAAALNKKSASADTSLQ